ncbi:twin-arginine translocase subunit TatC [Paenibacillus yanchengensis]|uniref:Sec-independent protein translocase protein TatC n=1 Tax=Paenibacillus yanchengensis TaxID=2035833 RepID=A0ABW4YHF6_9BACL
MKNSNNKEQFKTGERATNKQPLNDNFDDHDEEEQDDHLLEGNFLALLDHLDELRRRIFYILIIVVIGIVIGFIFAKPLYDFIITQHPANLISLHTFSLWDGIGIYMKFAIIIAAIIALPFTLYQLWAFVKPALKKHEQRSTLKYIPLALIMFLIGLAFSYFVVFPLAFQFTRMISGQLHLQETFGIAQFFTFMFNIILPIALLFELPLIIMFLTAIRIVNPVRLRKMRRFAYFLMIFIGVVITPPDFITDILVALPLIGLYEISVWLSAMIYRKQLRADQQWEDEFYSEDKL